MDKIFAFDSAGFAALSDLEDREIKPIYNKLDGIQREFLSYESQFRSPEYKWPRDSLNNWSRIWEYPYVYHNLVKIKRENPNVNLSVVDLGSGVTFFPFSVSRLGYDVTCVDVDPIVAKDIPLAANVIETKPGSISVSLINEGQMKLEDSSQDVVYCISVLEHIPDFQKTILDIARVLKKNGHFILTVDIDLRGDFELSANDFYQLESSLDKYFASVCDKRFTHPKDLLTSTNSPVYLKKRLSLSSIKRLASRLFSGKFFDADPLIPYHLAVFSGVYRKK